MLTPEQSEESRLQEIEARAGAAAHRRLLPMQGKELMLRSCSQNLHRRGKFITRILIHNFQYLRVGLRELASEFCAQIELRRPISIDFADPAMGRCSRSLDRVRQYR